MTFILLRIHLLGWNRRKRVTAIECGDGERREKLLKLLHTIKTYHKRNNRIKTNNNSSNGENENKRTSEKRKTIKFVTKRNQHHIHMHTYAYIFIQSKPKRRVWWWFVQHSLQKYQLSIERSLNIKFSVDCKIYCFIFMIVQKREREKTF